jgi:hypothetical protein
MPEFWVMLQGGADVGSISAFVLPMVGTMTIIITAFLPPMLSSLDEKDGD